jgi:hypothetical protein
VVLWEILTYGEVPYRGQPEANDCDHLAYYLRCGNRLVLPTNTSDEFRDLLTSCWMLNPDKRPSFSEVVSILDNQLSAAHVSLLAGVLLILLHMCKYTESEFIIA